MGEYYPVDPKELRERGTRGVISLGAGIGLFGINSILSWGPMGIIAGGGLIALGVLGLLGKTKIDKTGGILSIAGGIALIALKPFAVFILGAGALGLLAYGGWNLVKFVKGLKSRA